MLKIQLIDKGVVRDTVTRPDLGEAELNYAAQSGAFVLPRPPEGQEQVVSLIPLSSVYFATASNH